MGADLASGNDPDGHRGSDDAADFRIPSPRPAPDDDVDGLPENGSTEPLWWYDQPAPPGPEGERLREELAAAIRDLLDWALQQITESETDSDADAG